MQLFFDFDHTLLQTDAFVELRLKRTFEAGGVAISRPVWDRTLQVAIDTGYTPERHAAFLFDEGIEVSKVQLEQINALLFDISEFVFPDVVPFLEKQIEADAELWIVSYGASSWQHFKIERAGLGDFFPEPRRIITSTHGDKAGMIRDNSSPEENFVFIDNKPQEVVTVARQFPQARCYVINRTPQDFIPNEGTEEHALWWETYKTAQTREAFVPFPNNVREITGLAEVTV